MFPGHSLLDKAAEVCGSRYKVAQRLGVSEAYLSQVHRGKTPLSPKFAAKLADIAGLDAQKAAIAALIEAEKDPEEREALKRVFFRATAAAMLLFFIGVGWTAPLTALARPALPRQSAPATTTDAPMLCIMSTLSMY